MANGIYIGIDGVAKKVKKIYVGTNNTAKKVLKGYVGVNGVARRFYASEKKVTYIYYNNYYYDAESLASGNLQDYVLFAGGMSKSVTYRKIVNSFDYNHVRTLLTNLPVGGVWGSASASDNSYVLFGGSKGGYSSDYSSAVVKYDNNLTVTTLANLSKTGTAIGCNLQNNILFMGSQSDYLNRHNNVQYFDENFVLNTLPNQTFYYAPPKLTNFDDCVICTQGLQEGSSNNSKNLIGKIDSNLLFTTFYTLNNVYCLEGSSAGRTTNHVMFMGGYNSGNGNAWHNVENQKRIWSIDKNFVVQGPFSIVQSRIWGDAVSIDGIVVVAGGTSCNTSGKYIMTTIIDVLDDNLVCKNDVSLANGRYNIRGAKLNDKIFFGGGYNNNSNTYYPRIDIYKVE